MRIRIVSYEDVDTWILGKFAIKLCEILNAQGAKADIDNTPDISADINHHIIYSYYDGEKSSIDTVMITHIDARWKLQKVKNQLVTSEMGICMSSDTLNKLVAWGVPRHKLCYINPAQDGIIKPRKIILGITSKVQSSGCKRESMVAQLADRISPDIFKFKIMGSGWDAIVGILRSKGIEVDYYNCFDYKEYCELMPNLDYYLYPGWDEGSMGFLDAVAAGIPTIVTPQGYHLDIPGGITHPFKSTNELVEILDGIAKKRKRFAGAVSGWTWNEYARKHLLLWKYLLNNKNGIVPSPKEIRELSSIGVVTNESDIQRNYLLFTTFFIRNMCYDVWWAFKTKWNGSVSMRLREWLHLWRTHGYNAFYIIIKRVFTRICG